MRIYDQMPESENTNKRRLIEIQDNTDTLVRQSAKIFKRSDTVNPETNNKFSELSSSNLIAIIQLLGESRIIPSPGITYQFITIVPIQTRPSFALKSRFKPEVTEPGMYSQLLEEDREQVNQPSIISYAFRKNNMRPYYSKYASFKLHISLNNISNIDPHIIKGLIKLLNKMSADIRSNMAFAYKIIEPVLASTNERFKNNDQITIYFDKYSELISILKLADSIDNYLTKYCNPNTNILGMKDKISFNSFVSGRYDTLKLYNQYGIYPDIDNEINKFIAKFKATNSSPEDINKEVPLCEIEQAVHTAIIKSGDQHDKFRELAELYLNDILIYDKSLLERPRLIP